MAQLKNGMMVDPGPQAFDPNRRPTPAPDLPFMDRLRDQSFEPVFIMGEHRSGTTILYKMLGLSNCFNIVTAYHVLCHDQILADHIKGLKPGAKQRINDYLAAHGLQTRLVDSMPVDAEFSAEYGALLMRRRNRLRLSPRTYAVFDEFCRKVQFAGLPDRPLLLKNPPDSDNFLYLHQAYPRARFVFIHRHPIDVLSSQLSVIRRNWTEGNPWVDLMFPLRVKLAQSRWFSGLIRRIVAPASIAQLPLRLLPWRSRRVRAAFARRISRLPAGSYIRLRYEDLCRDPQKHMADILAFLDQTPPNVVDYSKLIDSRPRRWPPDVERAKERLCKYFDCGIPADAYKV